MKHLVNLMSSVIICLCVVLSYKNLSIRLILDSSTMYYLSNKGIGNIRQVYSDNTVNCDLTGVSNVINTLKEQGFVIEKEHYEKEFFDVILSKDTEIYRIRYERNGNLTSISKPYKNSSVPITYIDGKKD